ncbi:MAG: lipopolysaccharide assembly protein LapB [Gammaproteobacteria bacterium]|nr:lipopolysaccharide assembly protein LapB [Gammaproteobacteria bacterium]
MDIALLFLLLPVAAVSGWWLGKRNIDISGSQSSAGLSSEYFAGLNYLLNEQPDKAIDVFIKMLEINSDTVETYLALGNLFRRRGEGDRAIRIHQNLIARPTLSKTHRTQAVYELGKDYMCAGILGRAETLFLKLVDDKIHRIAALRNLLDIYQQERDWNQSITTARKIERYSNQKMGTEIAQYYCEQAEIAMKNIEHQVAMKLLKKALSHDKRCVRASLLIGNIEKANGNHKAAIRAFKQVENQNANYISEALEPMVACHEALGKIDEMADYLNQVLKQHDGITPIVALSEVTRLQHDEKAAADQIMQSLQRTPSISGLSQLIKLNLINSQGKMREQLSILNDIMTKLIDNNPIYKCSNCGFRGKSLHWHCPTCRQWCSVKPIQFREKDKYS